MYTCTFSAGIRNRPKRVAETPFRGAELSASMGTVSLSFFWGEIPRLQGVMAHPHRKEELLANDHYCSTTAKKKKSQILWAGR